MASVKKESVGEMRVSVSRGRLFCESKMALQRWEYEMKTPEAFARLKRNPCEKFD